MIYVTEVTKHTRRRGKTHLCGWCSDPIEIGEEYCRYRWYERRSRGTVHMHGDCYQEATNNYGQFYFDGNGERPSNRRAREDNE